MIELLSDPAVWASLVSLTILEIVLGIDNVLFISIATAQLEPKRRRLARRLGLSLAMIMRIALLFSISWIVSLTEPLFKMPWGSVSWRDIILFGGGLFLIYKAAIEVAKDVSKSESGTKRTFNTFHMVIVQIVVLDLVFSLDSVITAVGIAEHIEVMVAAIVIAVLVMMASAEAVSRFIERYPSTKMLALAFLGLVGLVLVADGLHYHVDRQIVYAAMLFAVVVEFLNVLASRRTGD